MQTRSQLRHGPVPGIMRGATAFRNRESLDPPTTRQIGSSPPGADKPARPPDRQNAARPIASS